MSTDDDDDDLIGASDRKVTRKDNEAPSGDIGGITAEQLKAYIERIERLEEEKQAIASDQREVYAEAKANGFDTKIMRKAIALRKMDSDKRDEESALLDLYMRALGHGS